MKSLQLTRGLSTFLDDADHERFSGLRWHADGSRGRFYARRTMRSDGTKQHVMLHRLIVDAPQGLVVDHINGDSLDNRRSNLRICTLAENNRNHRGLASNNTSGFRGVNCVPAHWRAFIKVNGVLKQIGRFDCPIKAAKAYDAAALEYHGEFASLNFPDTPSTEAHSFTGGPDAC